MERYICIHGHFYQPPRENPWLEAIEIQDSAYPYHDWNEKIASECYAPNSAARKLDPGGRILDIASNYLRMSFNFGPTLLSWLEKNSPETYQTVLDSDRQSTALRSGHGNALAQAYNHIIMPLATTRDKRTQILWGIRDFEHRFRRFPEGMWLPETAVDIETLDILAESGIKFTVLAPRQAWRARRIGTGKWKDVRGGRIDPSRAYLSRLPSGRAINLFFYDGPISQAVAFENLLNKGEDFVNRLLSGFSDTRQWPQIISIATDGETYGHHHKFGDMALAHALNYIESNGIARLTNYAEYLAKNPPTHEVEIFENSSWSCVHGIERWRSNCGCNSGEHPGWNQEWRRPLRDALDWLRDRLWTVYENACSPYLKDVQKARDSYIAVILDRSEENLKRFFEEHAATNLSAEERTAALKLLEMQRHAMLMYTSCGWFFDELSGLETVQVLQYAARAIQLSQDVTHETIEDAFKVRIAAAKSNRPEFENGAHVYEKSVEPAMIDLKRVGAHYAVTSLFEDFADETTIYCFQVRREDFRKIEAGITKLVAGKIAVSSTITGNTEMISFCVLHFGGHALNGGVRTFIEAESYESMKNEVMSTFEKGAFADIVRLMDDYFGMHNYSLVDLFRDQQRIIINSLISQTLERFQNTYRRIYESNRILMGFLQETGMPVKKAFCWAAEFTLNLDLKTAFLEETVDADRVQDLLAEIKKWEVALDSVEIEFAVRRKMEQLMERLSADSSDIELLGEIQTRLELAKLLPVEINYWQTQNLYYKIAKRAARDLAAKAGPGDEGFIRWLNAFKYPGALLSFNLSSLLPGQ
jgi:alpha-amylase/alpha-mannosidase (GH57 family)